MLNDFLGQFKPVLPHPNIYPSGKNFLLIIKIKVKNIISSIISKYVFLGTVCLSILNEEEDWKSSITIK